MNIIEANNIYFKFPYKKKQLKSRKKFSLFLNKDQNDAAFSLKDISLEVKSGEILGVLGRNGAGKSTLLKVLAGIYVPDKGSITVNGKISPVLGLGSGFRPELSGIDNIYLNGLILGLSKKEIDQQLNNIVSFAELNNEIHLPVKNYSNGMNARLGFSIALHINPNILIIDEVLSVGDLHFNKKAKEKMYEFMGKAKSIILCTHNINLVKNFCHKAIWMHQGAIKMYGDSNVVAEEYLKNAN